MQHKGRALPRPAARSPVAKPQHRSTARSRSRPLALLARSLGTAHTRQHLLRSPWTLHCAGMPPPMPAELGLGCQNPGHSPACWPPRSGAEASWLHCQEQQSGPAASGSSHPLQTLFCPTQLPPRLEARRILHAGQRSDLNRGG